MSRVSITYTQMSNRYRRASGDIDKELPRFCVNDGDKQAHSLLEDPVIVVGQEVSLDRWSQLTGEGESPVLAPLPPARAEKLELVCEDNSPYPVTCAPWIDTAGREMAMADCHEEALNLAKAQHAREAYGSPFMKMTAMVLILICVAMVLLITTVVVMATFGGKDKPKEEAVAMLSLERLPWMP